MNESLQGKQAQYESHRTLEFPAVAYKGLMQECIKDQSYNVIAAGITGLTKLASDEGSKALTALDEDTKNHVTPLIKRFSNQK